MKKIIYIFMMAMLSIAVHAESARSILDKAAASVSNPDGVQANFQIMSKQFGSSNGSISIKGRKFHATTAHAIVWFDGKTQWTYMKQNEEVNVSNPTEAELQTINPYNFINIYKSGFRLSSKKVGSSYEVHLKSTDQKRKIQEMYIIVDQKTYHPTHVKMRQNGNWTTLLISGLKTTPLSDGFFQFNAKDFPQAEIIDLR